MDEPASPPRPGAKERAGLVGAVIHHLATIDHDDRRAHYLLMTTLPGEVALSGPEALVQSDDNRYRPGWAPIADLADEPLVPAEARRMVMSAFSARTFDGW